MEMLPAALAGMSHAEARVDRAATRIAAWGAQPADAVDLSTEMVNLIDARTEFEANTKLVGTAEDMTRHLLDVLG